MLLWLIAAYLGLTLVLAAVNEPTEDAWRPDGSYSLSHSIQAYPSFLSVQLLLLYRYVWASPAKIFFTYVLLAAATTAHAMRVRSDRTLTPFA